jgi:hypothetical protein
MHSIARPQCLLAAIVACSFACERSERRLDMSTASPDAGVSVRADAGDPAQTGYDDGVYHCCAEGEGTSCCDDYDSGMCFEYGGIYHACRGQGEQVERKVICSLCCPGLMFAEPMVETDDDWTQEGYPEGCGPGPTPPSLGVCVSCGDGVCGTGENRCVCPADCAGD